MKILLPLVIILFSGCLATSHIGIMPSQPMPTGESELQVVATAGADHVEGQFYNSVLPYVSVYAGAYRAYKGVNLYEAGAMLHTPVDAYSGWAAGISGGIGSGKYTGKYSPAFSGNVVVDNAYTAWHLQPAIYQDLSDEEGQKKIGLSFKIDHLNFSQYKMERSYSAGSSAASYDVLMKAQDKRATIYTAFITNYISYNNDKIFVQAQLGFQFVKGFATKNKAIKGPVPNNVTKSLHPIVSPVILNICIGYRFLVN